VKGLEMIGLICKTNKRRRLVDMRTLNLVVTITVLILFVLAAGAPGGMGGIGMQSVEGDTTDDHCPISMTGLANMSTVALDQLRLKGLDCVTSP
jgi:hypothetical protein